MTFPLEKILSKHQTLSEQTQFNRWQETSTVVWYLRFCSTLFLGMLHRFP